MPLPTAKCAMQQQQGNGVETTAISQGQGHEARVRHLRHLEELLSTYQRERDEARDECLDLRDRCERLDLRDSSARTTSSNSVEGPAGHSNSMAAGDKPMELQQQQQAPHHSAGNLRGGSFSALEGQSLDSIPPSLQFELYANSKELSDLRQQQQLHQPKQEHQQEQEQGQGQLHHQQLQECHSNSSATSGTMSPTWTHDSLHLREPPSGDAHLPQGVISSFDSCSGFHLPSLSPTNPPVSGGEMLHGGGGGFRAESGSSSSLLHRHRPVHLPEPPEADMQVMLNSLPERGQLLQAVIQAGPMLQTLMLAGPLPQWRHPPPAVASVEIPKVAMPSGGSSKDKAKGTAAGSWLLANPRD